MTDPLAVLQVWPYPAAAPRARFLVLASLALVLFLLAKVASADGGEGE